MENGAAIKTSNYGWGNVQLQQDIEVEAEGAVS